MEGGGGEVWGRSGEGKEGVDDITRGSVYSVI